MEMRKLGRSGPEISVVGFGAWEAGGSGWGPRSEEESIEAIAAALDAGMNWIDTAEVYGNGRSEEIVGRALRGRSDGAMVFTKVGASKSGYHPEGIRAGIRGSLARLGTDHVDLYQIHWFDPSGPPIEETWGAMAEVVDEGLAHHIGVSNFGRELIERCEAIRHVDSVQNQFSLLHQDDRHELLPWLQEQGIGYLAYGPLAFGLLTGAIDESTTFPGDDWRSGNMTMGYYRHFFAPDVIGKHLAKVRRLKAVAERLGVGTAELALRGALEVQGVTGVIAGSTKANHVRSNAAAGDLRLDAETLAEIESIFAADS
jgi:aryl-alcohol dehydrogenase-like predicted oxidoreductase